MTKKYYKIKYIIIICVALIVSFGIIFLVGICINKPKSEILFDVTSEEIISSAQTDETSIATSIPEPTKTESSQEQKPQSSEPPTKKPSKIESSTHSSAVLKNHPNDYYAKYVQQNKGIWQLRLLNLYNTDETYAPETANVNSNNKFDKRAADALKTMVKDCKDQGINIWPQSSYRSVSDQWKIHNRYIKNEMSNGLSKEEATKAVRKYSMPGGASDHNLGLAVDFNTITMSFKTTPAYKWLLKNAEKYGFVLRFPADKTDITLVQFEPWHFRYVGEENAKKMNQLELCLEEYIAYLEGNI